MIVSRKMEINITNGNDLKNNTFQIGDQIKVGNYSATCQCVKEDGAIFAMDQYLNETKSMYCLFSESAMSNSSNYNMMNYDASDLRINLTKFQSNLMWNEIRPFMTSCYSEDLLRIPFAEELFGLAYREIKRGDKKQWPLMTMPKNRIATKGSEGGLIAGWLCNKIKYNNSYAAVDTYGNLFSVPADVPMGIRVVFKISIL